MLLVPVKLKCTYKRPLTRSQYSAQDDFLDLLQMSGLEGKIVLITGASSGIGAGTAEHFATLKAKMVLVGRKKEDLEAVAEKCRKNGCQEVLTVVKDLSQPQGCIDVVDDTVSHFGGTVNKCNISFLVVLLDNFFSKLRLGRDGQFGRGFSARFD